MSRLLFAYPFHLHDSALEQQWQTPYFPLGLLYLAATGRSQGHEVAVYDGTFQPDKSGFSRLLDTFQPDVVCFASLITLRPVTLALVRLAHERNCWMIAGGPDPTASPESYLSHAGVQAVVLGEGEETLFAALQARQSNWPLSAVAGLALLDQAGDVIRTTPREPIPDLETLPFPARDLIDYEPYFEMWSQAHGYTSMTLAASRGCPLGCEYCATSAVGPHFRIRRPEAVAAEMRLLQDRYRPDRFRFVDELEGLDRAWLLALADSMAAADVTTPYEGLRPFSSLDDLPMHAAKMALCGERNRWIPRVARHPHAPPEVDQRTLQERWGAAYVPPAVNLPDP